MNFAWSSRHFRLIQGRDRPRQSEAVGGGGFVARDRGPQPVPRGGAGHELLLRIRFEPRTARTARTGPGMVRA